MTIQEKFDLWLNGVSYKQLAEICGCSRQMIWQQLHNYQEKIVCGRRGHKFYCNQIKYQGIYEWFLEHVNDSIHSLCCKVFESESYPSMYHNRMKSLITGDHNAFFTVPQIQKLCEIIGKPFEEVFKERETNDR